MSNFNHAASPGYFTEEEDTIDIKGWIFRLIRLWPWFAATFLVSMAAAWLYLRYTEPVYQSTAIIMIKDEKKGGGSVLDNPLLKELNIGGQGKLVENETEILHSLDLIEEVVRREHLYISVKNKGRVADWTVFGRDIPFDLEIANPDSIESEFSWDINTGSKPWTLKTSETGSPINLTFGQWYKIDKIQFRFRPNIHYNVPQKGAANERTGFEIYLQPVTSAAQYYKGGLSVTPVGKLASVISLSMSDMHPEKATIALKALVEIYSQQGLKDKNLQTSNTIDFLNDRLDIVERELKGVEGQVEQYKSSNQITDVSSEAQAFLDLSSNIDRQKAEQETRVNVVDALERELIVNQFNPHLVPSSLGIPDPSLLTLIERHNEVLLQRNRLEEKAGAKNPALIDLDNQLKDIRLNLLENVKNLKAAYAIALADINRQERRLNSRLESIPSLEKNLVQISRDRNVKEQIYLYLLQKKEESAVSLASSVTDSRIIERARNVGQIKPRRIMVLVVALAFAFLLPMMIIFALVFFDNKVGDRKEIETNCKAPLLGEIGFLKNMKGAIEITPKSRSAVSEQLRGIRTGLSFTGKGEKAKTILVTSHRPGEGKSFTSLNLGASYALLEKKVVILEFDLRKPRLMRNLGLSATHGISTYLTRTMNLDEVLVEVPGYNGNFWVMPTGPIPPNPAELILGQNMKLLMDELLDRFDHVIIDSPPFSAVTDATLLQQYADIGVVILRQGYSDKEAYSDINNRINQFPDFPIYLVLNGVGRTTKYSYYGSKYGTGYGYYDEEKKNWLKRFLG